jgi:hypothetical protein
METYPTEQRALDVLDSIQRYIEGEFTTVYEMPKE